MVRGFGLGCEGPVRGAMVSSDGAKVQCDALGPPDTRRWTVDRCTDHRTGLSHYRPVAPSDRVGALTSPAVAARAAC